MLCLLDLPGPNPEGALVGGADPQWRPNVGRGIQEQSPGGGMPMEAL